MSKIRWNEPNMKDSREKILGLITNVLDTGFVSEGPITKTVEEELSKIVGTKHVIMTTSATAALYLAIEADKRIRGYTEGRVVIPDLTFVGTKNAVEMANLIPEFWDVGKRYMLQGQISLADLPKIVIHVNLLGRGGDKELINSQQPFTTICDNAGCLGSNVPNGKVGCYSLQANKLITCGQGGFCATDDDEYAKVIRQLKDFGRENKEQNDSYGFNLKFNDILATFVLGQIENIKDKKALLKEQYEVYKYHLQEDGDFVPFEEGELPLWVEFIVPDGKRDELYQYLKEKNIETRIPWKPFMERENAMFYYNNCLWLPNGPGLSMDNLKKVIDEIWRFYGRK